MKMDKETVKALDESIEAWREKTKIPPGKLPPPISSVYCPLCAIHCKIGKDGNTYCYGCPVRNKTGLHGCSGTPWLGVSMARDSYVRSSLQPGEHHRYFIVASHRMLAFLEDIKRSEEHEDG